VERGERGGPIGRFPRRSSNDTRKGQRETSFVFVGGKRQVIFAPKKPGEGERAGERAGVKKEGNRRNLGGGRLKKATRENRSEQIGTHSGGDRLHMSKKKNSCTGSRKRRPSACRGD